jgi:hypothetical protein
VLYNRYSCNGRRYLLVYASEGCQPQNRLFYLDLTQIPKADSSGALDFSSFDFVKGEARQSMQCSYWMLATWLIRTPCF